MGNFVIQFCVQLLTYCFQGENINSLIDFPILNQPYAERIIKFIKLENKIETSILIFTILTHLVTKSDKHLEGLKITFNTYFNNIFNNDSIFIKARLCVFLGFYLDELFNNNKNLTDASIQFLFINLFKYNQYQGLSYLVYKSIII